MFLILITVIDVIIDIILLLQHCFIIIIIVIIIVVVVGMALTTGHTFIHLTSAGKIETQNYFYKDFIIPRIRNSLLPYVNNNILNNNKNCLKN